MTRIPHTGALVLAPFGPMSILSDGDHLLSFHFSDLGYRDETPLLQESKRQLEAYFSGRLEQFDLPLRPLGTPFQLQVWQALQEIPYGSTISYRQLAEALGSPKAFRAVGGANKRNPLPIVIPCHRVIASNGALGGYDGGLHIKRVLLALEGAGSF